MSYVECRKISLYLINLYLCAKRVGHQEFMPSKRISIDRSRNRRLLSVCNKNQSIYGMCSVDGCK